MPSAPPVTIASHAVTKQSKSSADLENALTSAPSDIDIRLDCARALLAEGQSERAMIVLAEGALYHPGDPRLAILLAEILTGQGEHGTAQQVLTAGLRARPGHLELRGLLAAELAADLKTGEALRHLRLLLVVLPDQALVLANVGTLLQMVGRLDEAIRHYRWAGAIDPGNAVAQVNLATALMTKGEYGEAFERYERRRTLPGMRLPPPGLPRWPGGVRVGRLLVSCEQGFGDMLQFARFLPLLAEWADEVWLDCPREMKRLFSGSLALTGVASPGDTNLPSFDGAVSLLSLPHLLQTGADLLADSIPYIKVPSEGPALPPDRRPRIGLVWSGRAGGGDLFIRRTLDRRTCRFEELSALWSLDEFCFYSLQMGDAAKDRTGPVIDLAGQIGDFSDSAVLVSQLDLMISIDSAPAHLAGALGVPLWVMLGPGQADYRWGGLEGTSPWYPKTRLFRAGTEGWKNLAADIAAALQKEEFA